MPEKREPSWVDYGNLAANLVQVGQLSAVHSRLKQLAQIEAAREERLRLISELRQIVFEAEEGLQRITEYTTKAPNGVFLAVSILKTVFDEIGIVPQTFEEFADKDRVKQVRRLIEERSENASQILTAEQNAEVSRVLKIVPKLDSLESLIRVQIAKEKLAETKEEWEHLEEQRQKVTRPWISLVIVSVIAWIVGAIILLVILNLFFDINRPLSSFPPLVSIIISAYQMVIAIGFLAGMIGSNGGSNQRLRELNKERSFLKPQLLPTTKLQKLYDEFGEKNSQEYSALKNQIVEYIKQVTEKDRDGVDLPEPLLPMVMPSKLLQQENS
jgi:hypothetical protein